MNSLRALLLAAACVLAAQLVAGEPLRIKQASLHCDTLPDNFEPTSYDLHLRFSSLDSNVYEGIMNISLNFLNSTGQRLKNVPCGQYGADTIVLHADKSLEIKGITVTGRSRSVRSSEEKQEELGIEEVVIDGDKQMIAINLAHGNLTTIPGAPEKLSISFKGRIGESVESNMGLYFGDEDDEEDDADLPKFILSYFQPNYARTVFPCFDEKRFTAPFRFKVTHPRNLIVDSESSYAMMTLREGDLDVTRFNIAPDMKEFDFDIAVYRTAHL